jgi:hypothetical protein
MRIALLSATALILLTAPAHAMSGRELLRTCDAALKSVSGSGENLRIAGAGRACWQYMEAVQDMIVLADENGQRLLQICPPASGRLEGLVSVFVRYARAHPDELADRASVPVLKSLSEAFPCR